MSENVKKSSTRKKKKGFAEFIRRFCVPLLLLMIIVIVVLTVVLINKLAKENELKSEKETQIASLSARVSRVEATAVFED
ncbi:MAG: hypothetical protein IJS94_03770 [Clostridia bacterium]|nr:hypothetical protein [Clostridia bacterium]